MATYFIAGQFIPVFKQIHSLFQIILLLSVLGLDVISPQNGYEH